jgi:AmmeMemoRadiSam system protein B
MVPHAGYPYSGEVAARGFLSLVESVNLQAYDALLLVGPSHYVAFQGMAYPPVEAMQTPLGTLPVDLDTLETLGESCPWLDARLDAHRMEHCLEVQLPFLQAYAGEPLPPLLPFVVGSMDLNALEETATCLVQHLGDRVLWILSTDLYHGYSVPECELMDRNTLQMIVDTGDGRALFRALQEGEAMACGGLAAVLGLLAFEQLEVTDRTLLAYTNSAQVTGVFSGYTVGYASVAFARESET